MKLKLFFAFLLIVLMISSASATQLFDRVKNALKSGGSDKGGDDKGGDDKGGEDQGGDDQGGDNKGDSGKGGSIKQRIKDKVRDSAIEKAKSSFLG